MEKNCENKQDLTLIEFREYIEFDNLDFNIIYQIEDCIDTINGKLGNIIYFNITQKDLVNYFKIRQLFEYYIKTINLIQKDDITLNEKIQRIILELNKTTKNEYNNFYDVVKMLAMLLNHLDDNQVIDNDNREKLLRVVEKLISLSLNDDNNTDTDTLIFKYKLILLQKWIMNSNINKLEDTEQKIFSSVVFSQLQDIDFNEQVIILMDYLKFYYVLFIEEIDYRFILDKFLNEQPFLFSNKVIQNTINFMQKHLSKVDIEILNIFIVKKSLRELLKGDIKNIDFFDNIPSLSQVHKSLVNKLYKKYAKKGSE